MDVRCNPPLEPALVDALVDVWTAVSNAGGAVGFPPGVTPEDIRPTAETAFARVTDGRDDLAVVFADGQPVGMGFLVTHSCALMAHWGTVKRLQRLPRVRARGVGAALLAALEDAARRRGLRRVVVEVRGGTGTEGFYAGRGYEIEARLPDRIRLPGDDVRDLLVLGKPLDGCPPGPVLAVRRLDPGLPLPAYAHAGDAGLDLRAREEVTLPPGERAVVPTGMAVALPVGCVGLVHPRSGLAARSGIALVNAPGTVDAGYRGEIKVVVVNLDPREPVTLRRGDRIAQLVVQRVETVRVVEVDELDETVRGGGGFGSSGR